MEQLLAHLVGDYLLQTGWMAGNKASRSWPAAVHAFVYGLPFLLLVSTPSAWAVIVGTHFVIDRFRLPKYVIWAKEGLTGTLVPWSQCDPQTGMHKAVPDWMRVWLFIIVDNTFHLTINAMALRWLVTSAIG